MVSRQYTITMFPYFMLIVILLIAKTVGSNEFELSLKCCDNESVLNDQFECTKVYRKNINNETTLNAPIYTNKTDGIYPFCLKNGEGGKIATEEDERIENDETCVDTLTNGTRVKLFCNSETVALGNSSQQCDSLFTQMHLWGATIVVFATIVYNVPFIFVVIIYCAIPELRYRAYDKAVVSYNVCYMMINFLLIILGLSNLCHITLSITMYRLLGLGIMFWTQGAVIWLLIICFDMTLVITRFRWAPKGGAERGREERRKGLIYAAWGWGFATVLTLIATIVEFTPIFSEDSPIRPNFHNYDKPNVAVIIYVITGPVLICLIDTFLFIYTTAKTIAVQKSTAMIHENRKNNVKKKYFVFLKLYLLMDTPWLTGALGAIYTDLWILKFIKMIQPILILVLLAPRKRILQALKCSKEKEPETARLNNDDSRKKDNQI